MPKLKRLAVVVALTVAFAVPVAADDPCVSPIPGQTNTPPCAAPQTSDDSLPQNELATPSNSDTDVSVTELAINILGSVLTLF